MYIRKYGTNKCEATRLLCSKQVSESETFLIWQSGNLHLRAPARSRTRWRLSHTFEIQKHSNKYRNTVINIQKYSENETFLIWQSGNLHPHASATGRVKTVNKVALVSHL